MSSEPAISVQNLSKVYRIYDRPEHRLVQMATLGRVRRFKEFAALHDVSLTVGHGETVGIIGRNGCGKSTLLQVICGTRQPSAGAVSVQGRVAALLELGAGFNAEFTGRENVYMNGAILGFSREEMDARFEAIAQFASIGEFIERPVKTYSSGMYVRLAFAVATAVEPDILIVDEALAVGDEAFQRKCFARIEAIKERGGTILFVSHGAQTIIQLCDRAVLLDAGEKLLDGEPRLVVAQYQRLVNLEGAAAVPVRAEIRAMETSALAGGSAEAEPAGAASAVEPETAPGETLPPEYLDPALRSESETAYESQGAVIEDIGLRTAGGLAVNAVYSGRRYRYVYRVRFEVDAEEVGFGMLIKTVSGLDLGGATTSFERRLRLPVVKAGTEVAVEFAFDCRLAPGTYFMNAGVLGTVQGEQHYLHRRLDAFAFRVLPSGEQTRTGAVDIAPEIRVDVEDRAVVDTRQVA